jgi:hypothetical protein
MCCSDSSSAKNKVHDSESEPSSLVCYRLSRQDHNGVAFIAENVEELKSVKENSKWRIQSLGRCLETCDRMLNHPRRGC